MIQSAAELTVTRRKLEEMQARADRLQQSRQPLSDASAATLRTYRQWIVWLTEEIQRFEFGAVAARKPRFSIASENQLDVSRQKLSELEALRLKLEADESTPARDAALFSVRQRCNRLREEIAWYELHSREPSLTSCK